MKACSKQLSSTQSLCSSRPSANGRKSDYPRGDFDSLVTEQVEIVASRAGERSVTHHSERIREAIREIMPDLVRTYCEANEFRYASTTLGARQPVRGEVPTGDRTEVEVKRTNRQRAVDAYIQEVLQKKNKRITRTEFWKAAGDKTRTEFERWESYWYENRGRKGNEAAHVRFTAILKEKPHLK